MRYCPDASVLLAWLLKEDRGPHVSEFWTGLTTHDEMVAAMLLLPECTSVLREKAATGELQHDECQRLVGEMLELPMTVSPARGQFSRAVEMAERTGRVKAYDMQYLAAAEVESCRIVTIDGGMRQAAIEFGLPFLFLR
jgi:predicted nucleic acid-binding protein